MTINPKLTTEEKLNTLKHIMREREELERDAKRIMRAFVINDTHKQETTVGLMLHGDTLIVKGSLAEEILKKVQEDLEAKVKVLTNKAEDLVNPQPVLVISDLTNKDVTGHG